MSLKKLDPQQIYQLKKLMRQCEETYSILAEKPMVDNGYGQLEPSNEIDTEELASKRKDSRQKLQKILTPLLAPPQYFGLPNVKTIVEYLSKEQYLTPEILNLFKKTLDDAWKDIKSEEQRTGDGDILREHIKQLTKNKL